MNKSTAAHFNNICDCLPDSRGKLSSVLHAKLAEKIPPMRQRVRNLVTNYGSVKIDEVTVAHLYGGNRGVKTLVSDISYIDQKEGIRLRGYTIQEVIHALPRLEGEEYPLVGGLYYLLLTSEIPTLEEALQVECEWRNRSELPGYMLQSLKALPRDTHPMTMFSHAILSMQHESIFAKRYEEGSLRKENFWETWLEDSLNLTAKLPTIAATIYNIKNRVDDYVVPDPDLDWASNFAYMIGKGDNQDYKELCKLYFIIHSDHEGANASAHTTHLVSSTLSDVYYSCSAGMNALAGPLHGLANQGCLRWLLRLRDNFASFPTREQLEEFVWDWLNAGQVVPGYGHAVLRTTDPRFTVQVAFADKHCPDDELIRLVKLVYEVVPGILQQLGKVSNPWPNVDAVTGALQYHYGVQELDIYTVMFGVSRILGLSANSVWTRALGYPLERPKAMTTSMLEGIISADLD